jgi:Cu/Ag efflux protein CusF
MRLERLSVVAASLLMFATASAQESAAPTSSTPGVSTAQVARMSATVEKVDMSSRMITLRDSEGKEMNVQAGDEVRNLSQVKPGDRVDVTYYQSVAISLRKPGEAAPPTTTQEKTSRAPKGSRPEGMISRRTTTTAHVQKVDVQNHTVTVKSQDGKTETIDVSEPSLQSRLSRIKPGDTLDVTYEEALAVAVKPAEK